MAQRVKKDKVSPKNTGKGKKTATLDNLAADPDDKDRRVGGYLKNTIGDKIPHRAPYISNDPAVGNYLPDQEQSQYHRLKLFSVNPSDRNCKSFFYVVGNDHSDIKKCLIQIVHHFQAPKPQG